VVSAFNEAWAVWQEQGRDPQQFLDGVNWHMQSGWCWASPDCFIAARPVPRYAPEGLIFDYGKTFSMCECDAWYVWAAAGKGIYERIRTLDVPRLPWVGFVRRKKPKVIWVPLRRFTPET
jgi:hypothetical protein